MTEDPEAAARDWAVIWQSEAAALATDREMREAWEAALAATLGAPAPSRPPMPPPAATPPAAMPPAATPPAAVPPPDANPGPWAPDGATSDRPGPLRRRGPRPLCLHLAAATLSATPPAVPAGAAPAQGSGAPAARAPDAALLAGIAAYRRHPFRRALPDPPCLWHEGDTRLLDYAALAAAPGADLAADLAFDTASDPATGTAAVPGGASGAVPRRAARGDAAVPVLFVPSLVNRAQVLDLMPGRSLLRWLAAQGVRPLLLDWGWPGAVERRFTLADYVAGRLERAVASLGRPVVLAGYCMGGLLCTALAARRPDLVAGLVLLATPWDFHAGDPYAAGPARAPGLVAATLAALEPALALTGALGVDALQTLFELAAPGLVADKYRSFARVAQDSGRARRFVAIEDWLADGVPLAAPVARECLGGWYGANAPARGEWHVAGLAVAPAALRLPSLVVVPARDRIVPAASALALADALAGSAVLRPAAGHVGMIVGDHAERELWAPLRDWLLRHGAGA